MDPERVIEDARSVCSDLRGLFEQPGGPDNPEEVERLCEIACLVIEDPRCRNEVREVRRYAGFLLCGDHRRWARGTISGPVLLCRLILDLLRAIDIRLASLALRKRVVRARQHARLNCFEVTRPRVRAWRAIVLR